MGLTTKNAVAATTMFAMAATTNTACQLPVWPWSQSIYVPTYFQHGFGETGCYDENWGFEYMWDCLNDLKSGRALALYYYNLACNVPIYLHITMAADNDACVFFWWVASTVRHVGIGGKESSAERSVNTTGAAPACMEKSRLTCGSPTYSTRAVRRVART